MNSIVSGLANYIVLIVADDCTQFVTVMITFPPKNVEQLDSSIHANTLNNSEERFHLINRKRLPYNSSFK